MHMCWPKYNISVAWTYASNERNPSPGNEKKCLPVLAMMAKVKNLRPYIFNRVILISP